MEQQYHKKYYLQNKNKILNNAKLYYHNNKEKVIESRKKRPLKNKVNLIYLNEPYIVFFN